jgi:hypothetical protein
MENVDLLLTDFCFEQDDKTFVYIFLCLPLHVIGWSKRNVGVVLGRCMVSVFHFEHIEKRLISAGGKTLVLHFVSLTWLCWIM